MTVFEPPENSPIKRIAYGSIDKRKHDTVSGGSLFRLERAQPYYRAGSLVKAVPQFRAVNLFSPTTANNLFPTVSVTPTQVKYPVKVK